MMPFSPLRIWGLGIISWVLLGAGVYCIWTWANHSRSVSVQADSQPSADREDNEVGERRSTEVRASRFQFGRNWPLLAAGIGLLVLSGGGFFPVTWLLGKPGGASPRNSQVGHVVNLERPDGTQLHVESLVRYPAPRSSSPMVGVWIARAGVTNCANSLKDSAW